jgi:hypothetical protein
MHYSGHGHQTLPTKTMKTLSVQLAPQHLLLKTTKPNLNQHSKGKKKIVKNSPKQKTSKIKRTQNSTKSLESQYSTRCQEYQITTFTKETFLYKTTFTLQTKNPYPKQKETKTKTKSKPKLISTTTQNTIFFAKPRMETTSWKMNPSK